MCKIGTCSCSDSWGHSFSVCQQSKMVLVAAESTPTKPACGPPVRASNVSHSGMRRAIGFEVRRIRIRMHPSATLLLNPAITQPAKE
jgi:hypothetical protein